MAKDDYHYVAYHILKYLYDCVRTGKIVDAQRIGAVTSKYAITESYWTYIMKHLKKDGFIDGLSIYAADDEVTIAFLEDTEITPKGIAYLNENSTMQKIKNTLKDIKEITPGL